MDDLRFPIGRFARPAALDPALAAGHIEAIARAPAAFRAAIAGLDDAQLDTPYRPGGWTVRQVAHHLPDSHLNAYTRFKLALTEDIPTIKPYDEAAWARLADAELPVEVSLRLLEALHERWTALLRSLGEADLRRELVHPENGRMPLYVVLAIYAWHGAHHTAHVTALRARMGWQFPG